MKVKEIGKEQLKNAVVSSVSLREVLLKLKIIPAGGNYSTLKKKLKEFNVDISHFDGHAWNRNKIFGHKKSIQTYLNNEIKITSDALKKRLIEEQYFEHKCYKCERKEWEGHPIPIELHHKDGNNENNNLNNLIILCSNCHSLIEKNSTKRTKNRLDKDLAIKAIKESYNVREVLSKCGLSTKSNNHGAIYKLMAENGLNFKIKNSNKYFCNECGSACNNKNNICIKCRKKIEKEGGGKFFCKICGSEFKGKGKMCKTCSKIKQRKVERPLYEKLLQELKDSSYVAVGRKYGVSDNAVRKWVKSYEKKLQ